MGGSIEPKQPELAALAQQVENLRQRVSSLERLLGVVPTEHPDRIVEPITPLPVPTESVLGNTTNLIPLTGKALLGIAGAYLLRALTERGMFPLKMGVAIAIVYALGWLVLAARTAPKEDVTAAAYASTSVLILMPLVWEATVRFHAISCWTAAWILFLFSAFGLALSWRKFLSVLASITVIAGVLTSLALLIATDNLAPFTFGLLGTAAAVEFSACRGHMLGLGSFVACSADLAVLLLTYSVIEEPRCTPAMKCVTVCLPCSGCVLSRSEFSGPPSLAVETALDHALRKPFCWDRSPISYLTRYSRSFDRRLIRNTAEFGAGLLMGEDLRYQRRGAGPLQGRPP